MDDKAVEQTAQSIVEAVVDQLKRTEAINPTTMGEHQRTVRGVKRAVPEVQKMLVEMLAERKQVVEDHGVRCGPTHHFACACREAALAKIKVERDALWEALRNLVHNDMGVDPKDEDPMLDGHCALEGPKKYERHQQSWKTARELVAKMELSDD